MESHFSDVLRCLGFLGKVDDCSLLVVVPSGSAVVSILLLFGSFGAVVGSG